MKLKQLLKHGAAFCLLCLIAANFAFAQTPAPTLIPFQGRLTNQENVPYTGGQYTVTFNLYREAVGGTSLWTERHEKVGVINGMVNVFLGSITAFPATDSGQPFFATVKHLGITIDADSNTATADPEMVPRQMIIPAFYAMNAGKLAGHDWGAVLADGSTDPSSGFIASNKIQNEIGSVGITSSQILNETIELSDLSVAVKQSIVGPPGAISAFGGVNSPVGWLPCDGSEVDRSTYASLFTAIGTAWGEGDGATTFNLPDLRGMFLRGTNGGRSDLFMDPDVASRTTAAPGGNSGDSVGSVQLDQLQDHTHSVSHNAVKTFGGHGQGPYSSAEQAATITIGNPNSGRHGAETRPKNAYVNYIIKY